MSVGGGDALVVMACAAASPRRRAQRGTGDRPAAGAACREPRPTGRSTALAAIGRRMFRDPRLSASGRMSCASCHSPDHQLGPPNELSVQPGGSDLLQPGLRAVPSLQISPGRSPVHRALLRFGGRGRRERRCRADGGLTWDGRADSAHAQARIPLLSPFEMANGSPQAVVAAADRRATWPSFAATWAPDAVAGPDRAFRGGPQGARGLSADAAPSSIPTAASTTATSPARSS